MISVKRTVRQITFGLLLTAAMTACGTEIEMSERNTMPMQQTDLTLPVQNRATLSEGQWGGKDVSLNVAKDGIDIQFPCADGRINGAIRLNAKGEFSETGIYRKLTPGPEREGENDAANARYFGEATENTMRLKIQTASGEPIAEYELQKGRSVRLRRCL